MKAPTKTQIRKDLTELRYAIQHIERLLKANDWQDAYHQAQELAATAAGIEYTIAEHPEVSA
jgi:hypothetical protein